MKIIFAVLLLLGSVAAQSSSEQLIKYSRAWHVESQNVWHKYLGPGVPQNQAAYAAEMKRVDAKYQKLTLKVVKQAEQQRRLMAAKSPKMKATAPFKNAATYGDLMRMANALEAGK